MSYREDRVRRQRRTDAAGPYILAAPFNSGIGTCAREKKREDMEAKILGECGAIHHDCKQVENLRRIDGEVVDDLRHRLEALLKRRWCNQFLRVRPIEEVGDQPRVGLLRLHRPHDELVDEQVPVFCRELREVHVGLVEIADAEELLQVLGDSRVGLLDRHRGPARGLGALAVSV